nr:cobalt-precorrin-7 (C(5))-methyltransferase [Streptococcus catagoni]
MIDLIGIGPGNQAYSLVGHQKLFQEADLILGSERHLAILPSVYKEKGQIAPKKLQALEELLRHLPEERKVLYLASGDPLIYGLGRWLAEKFPSRVRIMAGVSAMQYLASRICLSMNDAYLTSSHAKAPNYDLIMSLPKVFMVTDQKTGPYQIAQEILRRGLKKQLVIGEQLSYPDEKITILPAKQVLDKEYKMNVVVVLDEGFRIYQNQGPYDQRRS